ncbi:MAG: hypothetical protein IKQ99_01365 [Alphaproteobacteria bacterium]|nr:hypothetical protein [Alphaproteobacteria bacterium]
MKKRLWIYPALCLVLGIVISGYFKKETSPSSTDLKDLWISQRLLPEKIPVDAYLTGNIARGNKDLLRAIKAYKKVLEQDPKNESLLESVYLFAMIQGVPEEVIPYLSDIHNDKMFSDYLEIANNFKKGDTQKALILLQQKKGKETDALLSPLIRAWIYAQKQDEKAAVSEINLLKAKPFMAGYQKVLLGHYFHDDDLIQKGINQMGDHDLAAVGYFPLLKNTIVKIGNWEQSALNKKYNELMNTYQATANLLWQIGQTEITPEKGLAETFYLMSATGGGGRLSREEALALNSISLLLQPDKQMALVWGAELSEGLQLPQVALSYYQRLKFYSATLEFKQATNLILMEREKEGLEKLEALEKTNTKNVPLLTLMGEVYQHQKQNEKALRVYNRLIPLLEERPQNGPLIRAYVARGSLYGTRESEKMLSDLKRAQALDPENPMLLNDLGYHQLEMGDIESGFELVQKAHTKKPNNPYILDSLAFGHLKKKNAYLALPLAERAVDLMPQSALINAHLGDIYAELGRHREAGFQYKKALDLEVDLTDDLKKELTQKLKKS